MALFNAGLIIRETRIAQGLSQEKLAEGICSRHTVVKIEAGTRKPEWAIFGALARRLGLEPDMFYNTIVTEQDAKVVKAYNECLRASGRDYVAFAAVIDEMEKDDAFNKGFGLFTYKRAMISKYLFPQFSTPENLQIAMDIAIDVLCTSRPKFDISNFSDYYLTHDEMHTLFQIAVIYYRSKEYEKAVELYQALIDNYDKNYMSIIGADKQRFIWSRNMMAALYEMGRYQDCLDIIDRDMKNSTIANDIFLMAVFVKYKAFSLLKLGKAEEGDEWFKKYACLAYGIVEATTSPPMAKVYEEYKQLTGKEFELRLGASEID